MMVQSGSYRYYRGPGFQAVSLPYGGGRMSMYIFLPAPDSSLKTFHASLTAANWEGWMAQFKLSNAYIGLPRFKVESGPNFNAALTALGMGVAFQAGRANFEGVIAGPGEAFLSRVEQRTLVEVNEEGTEAVSVTTGRMSFTSAEGFRMIVDRPFFCAIRDNATGTALFLGSIGDPN